MPDEDMPIIDNGNDSLPNIPINDLGQLTATPYDPFPNIPINDLGQRSFQGNPISDRFPTINLNDSGASE